MYNVNVSVQGAGKAKKSFGPSREKIVRVCVFRILCGVFGIFVRDKSARRADADFVTLPIYRRR